MYRIVKPARASAARQTRLNAHAIKKPRLHKQARSYLQSAQSPRLPQPTRRERSLQRTFPRPERRTGHYVGRPVRTFPSPDRCLRWRRPQPWQAHAAREQLSVLRARVPAPLLPKAREQRLHAEPAPLRLRAGLHEAPTAAQPGQPVPASAGVGTASRPTSARHRLPVGTRRPRRAACRPGLPEKTPLRPLLRRERRFAASLRPSG